MKLRYGRCFGGLVLVCFLLGCGQKGALYLPKNHANDLSNQQIIPNHPSSTIN